MTSLTRNEQYQFVFFTTEKFMSLSDKSFMWKDDWVSLAKGIQFYWYNKHMNLVPDNHFSTIIFLPKKDHARS